MTRRAARARRPGWRGSRPPAARRLTHCIEPAAATEGPRGQVGLEHEQLALEQQEAPWPAQNLLDATRRITPRKWPIGSIWKPPATEPASQPISVRLAGWRVA